MPLLSLNRKAGAFFMQFNTKDTKIKDTAPFFRPIFSEERHQKDTEA